MRSTYTILLVMFSAAFCFSQNNITISLIERPDNPLSDPDHFYLFEVKNNTTNTYKDLQVYITNVPCNTNSELSNTYTDQTKLKTQPGLNYSMIETDKITPINQLNVNANSTKNFYIKFSRNNSTILNTAHCFDIEIENSNSTAKSSGKKTVKGVSSKTLTIEQLIPDPNDFN